MREQCSYCGRFLKQVWHLTNDEPDGWQDYWACSLDAQHKLDHPTAYGLEPHTMPRGGDEL